MDLRLQLRVQGGGLREEGGPVGALGDVAGGVDAEGNGPLQEEGDGGWRQAGPEDDLAAEEDAVLFGVCGHVRPTFAFEGLLGFQELSGFNVVLRRARAGDFGDAARVEQEGHGVERDRLKLFGVGGAYAGQARGGCLAGCPEEADGRVCGRRYLVARMGGRRGASSRGSQAESRRE